MVGRWTNQIKGEKKNLFVMQSFWSSFQKARTLQSMAATYGSSVKSFQTYLTRNPFPLLKTFFGRIISRRKLKECRDCFLNSQVNCLWSYSDLKRQLLRRRSVLVSNPEWYGNHKDIGLCDQLERVEQRGHFPEFTRPRATGDDDLQLAKPFH